MSQAKLENVVLIVLIAVGVGLGIYYRTAGDNQLSAILLSLAFASVLYKFLGGTQADNSLSVGVIKFGGSAAVLGGFIWLLSQVVFKEEISIPHAGAKLSFQVEPATGWYAADTKTGAPVNLKLTTSDTTIQLPLHDVRIDRIKNRRFQLEEFENSHFYITPVGNKEDTLGQVYLSDIMGTSIASQTGEFDIQDVFIFKLFPHKVGDRSSAEIENALVKKGRRESVFPFPFIIKSYGTLYSVKNREDNSPILVDQEILQKNPVIIPEIKADGTTDYWVAYILHANMQTTDHTQHYMEWTVHRVDL
jgi:hypothetical protein